MAREGDDAEASKEDAKPARVLPTEPFVKLGLLSSERLPPCRELVNCYMPGGGRCVYAWERLRSVTLSQAQLQARTPCHVLHHCAGHAPPCWVQAGMWGCPCLCSTLPSQAHV